MEKLRDDLQRNGHFSWIDDDEIRVGDSLITKIREGIDYVDYVLAVLSRTSIGSKWVQRELDVAMNLEISRNEVFVLPILVADVALPGFLEGKLYADFREPAKYEIALSRLLKALSRDTPRSFTFKQRVTVDARTLRQLRKEVLYGVTRFGDNVFTFITPDVLANVVEMIEFDRTGAEGYITAARFMLHALTNVPPGDPPRIGTLVATSILMSRTSEVYLSGVDGRLSVPGATGQRFGFFEQMRIDYPSKWDFALEAARACFLKVIQRVSMPERLC